MAVEVFFVGAPPNVVEGTFLDKITLLTSSPVPFDEVVTVNFSIIPGTATPQQDYAYKPILGAFDPVTGIYTDSLIIPGGASIASLVVDILQDDLEELDEGFDIVITSVSDNATIGSNAITSVTIQDDDNIPNQVTISALSDASESGGDIGQFIVSLTEAAATETVITYTVGGSALADADYVALTGSVTIPAGSLSATIDITAIDDSYLEGDETVLISLDTVTAGDEDIVLGSTTTAIVTLKDDASTVLYRVNAGGPEIAAIDDGPNWLADDSFLLVPGSDRTSGFASVEAGDTVPLSTPGEVFDTERFDMTSIANDTVMQYAFDVDPGLYEVRLYMGNGFAGTSLAGERVFDVAIEGQVLPNLNNIDLSANFGHLVGGMLSNEIAVTDGSLNLEFLHDAIDGIQNPLINGIEIIQIGDIEPLPTVSVVGESYGLSENGRFSQTTLLTSKPVPSDGDVTITVEILPGTAAPLQGYVYESLTATFDPQTGVYTDTVTLSSGFSVTNVVVSVLEDSIQEGSGAFTVNISDVSGANFEIGTSQLTSATIVEDSVQPLPLLIEAESTSYTTYQLESLTAASGGQVLKFGGSEVGEVGVSTIALDTLTGFTPGEYDVSIGTFDMLFSGGQSATTFSVELNGEALIGSELSLRNAFVADSAVPGELVERVLATGVDLGAGDTLSVTGFENPDEVFWLDYIQLTPVVPDIV